jgi:hypothetical protein
LHSQKSQIGYIKDMCTANKVHDSDLSVDFTVRWTDEDNYIIKYIEYSLYMHGCSEIALYKAL